MICMKQKCPYKYFYKIISEYFQIENINSDKIDSINVKKKKKIDE